MVCSTPATFRSRYSRPSGRINGTQKIRRLPTGTAGLLARPSFFQHQKETGLEARGSQWNSAQVVLRVQPCLVVGEREPRSCSGARSHALFESFVEWNRCGRHGRGAFIAGVCRLASPWWTCRIDRRSVRTRGWRRCRRCSDCDCTAGHRGRCCRPGRQLRSAASGLCATAFIRCRTRLLLRPATGILRTRRLPTVGLRAFCVWTACVWLAGLWACAAIPRAAV